MRRHIVLLSVLGVIVALLVIARLALPGYLEKKINAQIAQVEDLEGGIGQVRLALLSGAYAVEGLQLSHSPQDQEVLHVEVERIAMNLSWSSLFRGRLVGNVRVEQPQIHTMYVEEDVLAPEDEIDLSKQLQQLFPFRIDTVEVRNGTLSFRTPKIEPRNALMLRNVNANVRNITNIERLEQSSFANFDVQAEAEGEGPLSMEGRLDPTAKTPTFDLNLTLRNLPLTTLNPWLQEYATVQAKSGIFETYIELAAADGNFEGYVRPHAIDIEITSVEDSNFLQDLWAGLVDFVSGVLESDKGEQDAARVPISGSIDNPDIGVLPTIISMLRNAFVASFARSLAGSVSLEDVTSEQSSKQSNE